MLKKIAIIGIIIFITSCSKNDNTFTPQKFKKVTSTYECINLKGNLVTYKLNFHPDSSEIDIRKYLDKTLKNNNFNAIECYKIK